jgi:PKD repeat protein
MDKPTFSVNILNSTAPAEVEFTDTSVTRETRIQKIFTGDGTMLGWDVTGQTVIRHTYKKPGTYIATAVSVENVASDPKTVIILGTPTPPTPTNKSWWRRFLDWLAKLFG